MLELVKVPRFSGTSEAQEGDTHKNTAAHVPVRMIQVKP